MDPVQQFVTDARAKGWDDEQTRQALLAAGWEAVQVDAALSGLHVPKPPVVAGMHHGTPATSAGSAPALVPASTSALASASVQHGPTRPSIHPLQAALHHVLLWVFTLTSSTMIGIVCAALFAGGIGSSETLLTYLVLELVTFTPFAVLYWLYLKQLKQEPDVTTGKVWSIITVVLHSIGLIGATIAFILVFVLVHNAGTKAGLIASGTIAVMDALVVIAYGLANFAKLPLPRLAKRYVRVFPIALFVLIAILGVISLFRLAPLRADDQTKQNLSTTVQKVHQYAQDHHKLPASLGDVSGVPGDVSYERTSAITYQVCATFRTGSDYYDTTTSVLDDSYSERYVFSGTNAGRNCWKFKNYALEQQGGAAQVQDSTGAGVSVYHIR